MKQASKPNCTKCKHAKEHDPEGEKGELMKYCPIEKKFRAHGERPCKTFIPINM